MAREDLNPIEEARACAALVEELGLSREEVGRRVGRSRVAVTNLVRLLDLPDEALELLERGVSARATARAAARRGPRRPPPARARAAEQGWSVRVAEQRARESNAAAAETPRPARAARGVHPDQEQAARDISEALAGALGAEVRVKPARDGSYRAELSFATPAEALELARRIRPHAVA